MWFGIIWILFILFPNVNGYFFHGTLSHVISMSISSALSTTSSLSPSSISSPSALIVGGGPAGLATSLMLSQQGWKDIVIVEKRPDNGFDSDRAYMYLIDGRGQRCIGGLLGMMPILQSQGVNSLELYNYTVIETDGTQKVNRLFVDRNTIAKYWIPRAELMEILYTKIQSDSNIKVIFNASCQEIYEENDGQLNVLISKPVFDPNGLPQNKEIISFRPKLLIGCDGISSSVREWLASIDPQGFTAKQFASDAAGVQYKILKVDGQFIVNATINPPQVAELQRFYALAGKGKGLLTRNRMGFLPVKRASVRSANINRLPRHEIWKINTLSGIKQYLQRVFPQVNMSTMFSDKELERFATSRCGVFPKPQRTNKLFKWFGKSGAVLIGDSAHSFPPDLGQGVNSALEDVVYLDNALKLGKSDTQNNLGLSLAYYEVKRLPEIKALITLMTFGYPYQYDQYPLRNQLWKIHAAFRVLLSKAVPFVFDLPVFMLIQNHNLSYQQILWKSRKTTAIILLGLMGMLFGIGNLNGWKVSQTWNLISTFASSLFIKVRVAIKK